MTRTYACGLLVTIGLTWLASVAEAQPGQPGNVQATVGGSTLTVTWTTPSNGTAPTSYRLEFRDAANAVVATLETGVETSFSVTVPPGVQGTFSVAVTAVSGFLTGPPSAPVIFVIGSSAPGPPGNLQVNVGSDLLSASWTQPTTGPSPTGYLLEFRTYPADAPVAVVPVGPTPSFAIAIPPGVTGTFTLTVAAVAGAAQGPRSEPALFILTSSSCTNPPAPPTNLRGSIASGVITVQWDPSPNARQYQLTAGSAFNSFNLFDGSVGNQTSISAAVPANFRAYIRVAAANECGSSVPTPQIVVPGSVWDGRWAGMTTQNRGISFEIEADVITRVQFNAAGVSADRTCDGWSTGTSWSPMIAVQNGEFAVSNTTPPDPEFSITSQITGRLNSASSANGTLSLTMTNYLQGCTATLNATWTATRQP